MLRDKKKKEELVYISRVNPPKPYKYFSIGGMDKSGRSLQAELLTWNINGYCFPFPNYGLWSGKQLMKMEQMGYRKKHPYAYYHLLAYNGHETTPNLDEIDLSVPLVSDGSWMDMSFRSGFDGVYALVKAHLNRGLLQPTFQIFLLDTYVLGDPITNNSLRFSYRICSKSKQGGYSCAINSVQATSVHASVNATQQLILNILHDKGHIASPIMKYHYDNQLVVVPRYKSKSDVT